MHFLLCTVVEAARSEEAAFMSDDDTLSELQVMAMLDEVECEY